MHLNSGPAEDAVAYDTGTQPDRGEESAGLSVNAGTASLFDQINSFLNKNQFGDLQQRQDPRRALFTAAQNPVWPLPAAYIYRSTLLIVRFR